MIPQSKNEIIIMETKPIITNFFVDEGGSTSSPDSSLPYSSFWYNWDYEASNYSSYELDFFVAFLPKPPP